MASDDAVAGRSCSGGRGVSRGVAGVATRDDVGVKDGWRVFKSSRAKKTAGVAMWPTNLQLSSAVVRTPGQRPLTLTVREGAGAERRLDA